MAEKQLPRSSYEDYVQTLHKIAPQLRTLLAHVSSEETAAGRRPGYSGTRTRSPRPRGTPSPRRRTIYAHEECVQAVSNSGKIVYGVVRDGKLEVRGTVGEVNTDLLGVDAVNAGRASRRGTRRTGSPSRTSSPSRRRTSSPSRRSGTSSSKRGAPSRRRNDYTGGESPQPSDMPADLGGME
uniref:25 kDa core protein OPG138 n=1 Tax=Rousettus bat poxvirus TaxID=3141933 RepID=A0AAU7E2F4_9POXV